MGKSDLTKEIEKKLWQETNKMGVFGCFEVTIGWFGNEIVDYITYDTKGIWRCYEIKVSKSDFHSKAKKTFIGHYNYYVMPDELYQEVKGEIPNHIGVHNGIYCVKNAKKQELAIDEQILKNSMIRSLSREKEKLMKMEDPEYLNRLRNQITRLEKESRENNRHCITYKNAIFDICEKYNLNYKEIKEFLRNYD